MVEVKIEIGNRLHELLKGLLFKVTLIEDAV